MSRCRLRSNILILLSSFYLCFNLLPNFFCHEEQLAQYRSDDDRQYARSTFSNPLTISNSSSFNKYAFLTAHEYSYSRKGDLYRTAKNVWFKAINERVPSSRTVTEQLNRGVRALILKFFDRSPRGDDGIWVGQSDDVVTPRWFDSYGSALDILKEVEEFLSSNPFEILTLILEDCVTASNGLLKVFGSANLTKYLLPLKKMPRHGGEWPLVKDMVAANQRLLVFTSNESKEESEGIAYTWNFMIECKYGITRRGQPHCTEREYLPGTYDTSKSLVLFHYYASARFSQGVMNAIHTCYAATSNRWANFIVVDNEEEIDTREGFYYFEDFLNGKHLCGCHDVNSCKGGLSCPLMAGFDVLCWGREAFLIRIFHPLNIFFIWIVMCSFYCRRR